MVATGRAISPSACTSTITISYSFPLAFRLQLHAWLVAIGELYTGGFESAEHFFNRPR
jgi:hypothetical protein